MIFIISFSIYKYKGFLFFFARFLQENKEKKNMFSAIRLHELSETKKPPLQQLYFVAGWFVLFSAFSLFYSA
ncbi:hypothetical protein HMPREF9441_02178 [Paraprevotella clara YIT 11840]|uniref:Uncharacterized protein n=1 Tax=Paraprevotella clara YIT 11840 TaxID=762968 RepID=G5SS29_9BACT|nr:hypothetical protein HMPREF9441_02178 [Paraprevotella clara YIT 11840]